MSTNHVRWDRVVRIEGRSHKIGSGDRKANTGVINPIQSLITFLYIKIFLFCMVTNILFTYFETYTLDLHFSGNKHISQLPLFTPRLSGKIYFKDIYYNGKRS